MLMYTLFSSHEDKTFYTCTMHPKKKKRGKKKPQPQRQFYSIWILEGKIDLSQVVEEKEEEITDLSEVQG